MKIHSYIKRTLSMTGLLGMALIGGCSDSGDSQKLVVTGSSTVAPLVSEIAKRFEMDHPHVRIDVQAGGSSRGVADARTGLADIGMASRQLNAAESDLIGTPIARDGIGIILHKSNPVADLSDEQIVQIFTGKIRNWRQVGGNNAPITVINKAEGRSTLELFLSYYGLQSKQVKASVIIGDNEQGIKTLTGNPDSIGYVSIGAAEYNVEAGIPIKLLPTNGVTASTQSVRNDTFPLSRPLTLVTRTRPVGLAKEFIDFARSPAVHDLVRQLYFVPLS